MKSEAYKTRYYNRATHIKTEAKHIYTKTHVALCTKDKDKTEAPIHKDQYAKR